MSTNTYRAGMNKEILLIRHGKPKAAQNHKVSAAGFANWVRQYDKSYVCDTSRPKHKLDLSEHYVISSDLKRAIHSAEIYTQKTPDISLPLFREMDIPWYPIPIKAKAWNWVYLNRLIWLLGKTGPFESFGQAKARSIQAAEYLADKINEQQAIAVFAHAMMNRFLCKELQRLGWQCANKDYVYWGITRLVKQ